MKILFTRKLFLVGIFLFLAGSVFGQVTLQGIVTDSTTHEALVGATIFVTGTSLGVATDFNGEYKLPNIPEGRIKLRVSYIGYATKNLEMTISGQKAVDLFILLSSKSIEGKTVVVTAQASGQLGAINQQLTSATISNIVSADKIRQLPDDNAATALSRLPGVSLMNGDQVVIRGIEAKLNQVLVNGIQMPSTDMNNRSTNLGFISSNMLSSIEVIKAITPDMDANTVGGVVNLKLASAQPGLHFDVMAQGNYNSSDRSTDTYKIWGSISDRFLDDKLGVFLQGNADRSDGGNQSASLGLTGPDLSGSQERGQGVYKTTSANFYYNRDIVDTKGGSIILDYKLPHGKIIMQNTYAATAIDQRDNTIILGFTGNGGLTYTVNRDKYGKELWINSLQAENSFGNVKVEGSLSHSFTDQYTKIGYDAGNWISFTNSSTLQNAYNQISGYYNTLSQQTNMPLSRTYGIFDNINKSDADSASLSGWPGAFTNTFKQHLYNAALDVSVPVAFSDNVNATFKVGGKFVRTARTNDFQRYFAGQDPYAAVSKYFPGTTLSNSNGLRFDLVRDNNFTRGKYFLSDEYNFKNGFTDVVNTDIYDPFLQKAISGWVIPIRKDQSWQDDWMGAESFSAGYAMATFNIFDNITLLGGVRFESYNMQYHAQYTYVTHNVDGDAISTRVSTIGYDTPGDTSVYHSVPYSANNINRTDNNVFPDVQLKFKTNEWSDIRVAYTTGISRPDYSSIIPKVSIDPNGRSITMGNPLLRPTKVQNVDLILSVFSNKVGLFTINGFYKELKDVIYSTTVYYDQISKFSNDISIPDSAFLQNRFNYQFSKTDNVNVTINNNNKAYIRGIEIDWQTNFWYLPEPFNSIVLDVNYTKSASHLDYLNLRSLQVRDGVDIHNHPKFKDSTEVTTYSGRLLQQANDVINVALGVDYKGFSGRISFNMRGNVLNYVNVRPEQTSYTGNILRWDFVIKQNLPVDGLSLSLNGTNIFHNAIRSYQDYKLKPDQQITTNGVTTIIPTPVTQNLVSILYSPTVFQLNLRYTF